MCVFYFASHLLLVVWSSIKGFLKIDSSNFFSVGNRAGGYAVQPLITFKIAEFSTHISQSTFTCPVDKLSTMKLSRKCEKSTSQGREALLSLFPHYPTFRTPAFQWKYLYFAFSTFSFDHPSKWIVGKTGLNYYRNPLSVKVMYRVISCKPRNGKAYLGNLF